MTERRGAPGDAPARETGLIGGVEERAIVVVPYRPDWPETFRRHRERIAAALGAGALGIEHIGSTAVPGLVSVNGVVVNEQLVRDGHAWAYDRRLPVWLRARYKGFERTAQDSGAGLWGAKAKPIPPWEWRNRKAGRG